MARRKMTTQAEMNRFEDRVLASLGGISTNCTLIELRLRQASRRAPDLNGILASASEETNEIASLAQDATRIAGKYWRVRWSQTSVDDENGPFGNPSASFGKIQLKADVISFQIHRAIRRAAKLQKLLRPALDETEAIKRQIFVALAEIEQHWQGSAEVYLLGIAVSQEQPSVNIAQNALPFGELEGTD